MSEFDFEEELEDLEDEMPFAEVLTTLQTADDVAVHLLYRFSDMSAQERAHLEEHWLDAPEQRRRVIARHMADLSEENYVVDFVPVFRYMMLNDPFAGVRTAALDGLWDATDTSLIEPILELVRTDESMDVRASAASALAHFVLMAEWKQVPRKVSPKIVEALLVEYEKPSTSIPVKRAALEAMGAAAHPRVGELIEAAYASDEFAMRLSAVFAMGSSADERWLPILLEEMESPEMAMRAEAARAAGAIGHEDAVPMLARLAADEELDVALVAVRSLGQIGGEDAENVLTVIVEDDDFERLREAADEALAEINWLSGTVDLFHYAEDQDTELTLPPGRHFERDCRRSHPEYFPHFWCSSVWVRPATLRWPG